jgi:hypothetical protein
VTTPAPCRDCQRLTWAMRGICPWCEGKRREKAAAEEAERAAMNPAPVFKTKRAHLATGVRGEFARLDDVQTKRDLIEIEGMGVRLADG